MSNTVLELFRSRESYAQTAHNESLVVNFSDSPYFTRGIDRVLSDANSAPLLHAKGKAKGCSLNRIDVYRGESSAERDLAFTVKVSSLFSKTLHIFLAGSSLDGPPDYKLKPASCSNSMTIFRQDDVVAKAEKDFIICGCFEPNYIITISSGMDEAMVVLLVVIHEDLRRKRNRGGGGAKNFASSI